MVCILHQTRKVLAGKKTFQILHYPKYSSLFFLYPLHLSLSELSGNKSIFSKSKKKKKKSTSTPKGKKIMVLRDKTSIRSISDMTEVLELSERKFKINLINILIMMMRKVDDK